MSNQIFFFTENPTRDNESILERQPLRNTINYMNKFTVTENDQFEISGFYVLDHPLDLKKFVADEKTRWRISMKEKRDQVLQDLASKLSTCEGIVNVFLSGSALFKNETGKDLPERQFPTYI